MDLWEIELPYSSTELTLRAKFECGEPLDLNEGSPPFDGPGQRPYEERRRIRASVLREIVLSATEPAKGYVRKLELIGADIVGGLDLRFATIDFPIRLEDCTFDSPVVLAEAELRSVSLCGSLGETIDASHMRIVGDFLLERIRLSGQLNLRGAHLDDDLHLTRAEIRQQLQSDLSCNRTVGRSGSEKQTVAREHGAPLLILENMDIKGTVYADGLKVWGTVNMNGAHVAGSIQLKNAKLGHDTAGENLEAWTGDGLQVNSDLDASELCAVGQVRLVDACMGGLALTNGRILYLPAINRRHDGLALADSPPSALVMDRLRCAGSIFSQGIKLLGGIHAIGIDVGAKYYLGKARVWGSVEGEADEKYQEAVNLQGSRLGDDLRCNELRARGGFDIRYALIGGSLWLNGSSLTPTKIVSPKRAIGLNANRTHIVGNIFCGAGFVCDRIIGLVNAYVDGDVRIDNSACNDYVFSPTGLKRELLARGFRGSRKVELRTTGSVVLTGADITGDLVLDLAQLTGWDDGEGEKPAADLRASKAGVLSLKGRPLCGLVNLTQTSAGVLSDDPGKWRLDRPPWPPTDSRIDLAGLHYEDLLEGDTRRSVRDRLDWLKAGAEGMPANDHSGGPMAVGCPKRPWNAVVTPLHGRHSSGTDQRFAFQPYQQLATLYRHRGQDSYARDVLYTMYCRHSSVMHKGRHPFLRLWDLAQQWSVGYGYRAGRAFLWVAVLAAGTSFWLVQFNDKARLSVVQAAILSLGLALPGSGLDKVERWNAEVSDVGHLLALILVLAGLLLGATVIAAIGRAVRR